MFGVGVVGGKCLIIETKEHQFVHKRSTNKIKIYILIRKTIDTTQEFILVTPYMLLKQIIIFIIIKINYL